mmetsp:Transcript_21573/g.51462  ORF Transcript_21573/g.51462 Transcript_21573/m.51462 type:complete len:259 (-) Transcript_21573:21-797(-)
MHCSSGHSSVKGARLVSASRACTRSSSAWLALPRLSFRAALWTSPFWSTPSRFRRRTVTMLAKTTPSRSSSPAAASAFVYCSRIAPEYTRMPGSVVAGCLVSACRITWTTTPMDTSASAILCIRLAMPISGLPSSGASATTRMQCEPDGRRGVGGQSDVVVGAAVAGEADAGAVVAGEVVAGEVEGPAFPAALFGGSGALAGFSGALLGCAGAPIFCSGALHGGASNPSKPGAEPWLGAGFEVGLPASHWASGGGQLP